MFACKADLTGHNQNCYLLWVNAAHQQQYQGEHAYSNHNLHLPWISPQTAEESSSAFQLTPKSAPASLQATNPCTCHADAYKPKTQCKLPNLDYGKDISKDFSSFFSFPSLRALRCFGWYVLPTLNIKNDAWPSVNPHAGPRQFVSIVFVENRLFFCDLFS